MLQNLNNALLNSAIFEHHTLKIYSRLTHAFKMVYFGIHFVDQEDTLQYKNQFSTLFKTLTQVVYQSIEDPISAQAHELAGTGPPTTNQDDMLAQFIQDSSVELKAKTNKALIKACLKHIQRQDVKAADEEWQYDSRLEYDQWLLSFKQERTVFKDSFIEWLLTLYMASRSTQNDEEINREFYRIRQLGLVKLVREKYSML